MCSKTITSGLFKFVLSHNKSSKIRRRKEGLQEGWERGSAGRRGKGVCRKEKEGGLQEGEGRRGKEKENEWGLQKIEGRGL